jgi:hypothetical protein
MSDNNQLITIVQSGRIGDFKVVPDNVMVLPGVELYDLGLAEIHEALTKTDQGNLTISSKSLAFTGASNTISFPLSKITRVQPYENAIDIYEKGRKKPYKFAWGDAINMKLAGIPGDDGKIKPLAARIVAQFIINERNRVGNLIRAK